MYSIRVDIDRNRLYVTLAGFFSLDEIKKCGDETIEATRRLRSGYDVVTDITQFKAGTADVAAQVERVQAHFRRSGARQGVRIVGSNAVSAYGHERGIQLSECEKPRRSRENLERSIAGTLEILSRASIAPANRDWRP
jgi:hypothetical protein